MTPRDRRLPVGAELHPDGVHFRVWAPLARRVDVVFGDHDPARGDFEELPLEAERGGWFSGLAPGLRAGALYRLRLDGGDLLPDPASRFQPEGPHGASQVVAPGAFRWSDQGWNGVDLQALVFYELHLGTFTPEGDWRGAAARLPELADLGVTAIEVLPVAEFTGRFGWGYDGVDLFAPTRLYGAPDDMRAFVDRAHGLGLGVILDVVYNHFGPDGNYLGRFSAEYVARHETNEWGEALNFDGPGAEHARALYLANAAYWIDEFHLDGLRIDATHAMHDASEVHVLRELAAAARRAAGPRTIVIVAENESQEARLLRPTEAGGHGIDMVWNDDFHHAARVALTGHAPAYYSGYTGSPQELLSAATRGWLYQGQFYAWQRKRRGSPAPDVPPHRFVTYLQNHDQVANSLDGRRIHALAAPGRLRALTALLLLGPGTPLLFQGQELMAGAPFLYFADHPPELAAQVRRGRREFLAQFAHLAPPGVEAWLADPADPGTFRRCVLDDAARAARPEALRLHKDLLRLRRTDPGLDPRRRRGVAGAVLGPEAFALRWFARDPAADRLLLVNLGPDLELRTPAEPLLAPPERTTWQVAWSSDRPEYGGEGHLPDEQVDAWHLPGQTAHLFRGGTPHGDRRP